jgi:hypothetical protein
MDVAVYKDPLGFGTIPVVYDDGDGGIVEINPAMREAAEVDGVPSDWIPLSPAQSED